MPTALTPVFVGLRSGLHLLVAGLGVVVVARGLLVPADAPVAVVSLTGAFLAVYGGGGMLVRAVGTARAGRTWLAALLVVWMVLLALVPEAAYLAFPLFFLCLQLLPRPWSLVAVGAVTGVSVVGLAARSGWTVAGALGPVIGAGVAVLIGLGYQALAREAREREDLLAQLLATRSQLARSERAGGAADERSRLAREIHDTVAQGLASIQLLLHAAERADPHGPGAAHVRLARETAASGLAETRRFVRELTPPDLDGGDLAAALRRLAGSSWTGLEVEVRADSTGDLPMATQTALLRIAQGALANVEQHAAAEHAVVSVQRTSEGVRLTVSDDGHGFDVDAATTAVGTGSFGLRAMRERVAQLDGELRVTSSDDGTRVQVDLPVAP